MKTTRAPRKQITLSMDEWDIIYTYLKNNKIEDTEIFEQTTEKLRIKLDFV